MNHWLRAAFCAALFSATFLLALPVSGPALAQDLAVGQCVLASGAYAKVLGPSPVAGLTLVQSLRGGSINGYLPSKLTPVACPGAPQAKHTCFASDPDTGQNSIDWAIRHYLATNGARPDQTVTTHFRSVSYGTSREATVPEQVDIGDGDFSAKILDAHVVYDTCWDDGAIIHLTHFNRNFICFKTKSTHTFACGVRSVTDMTDDTTEQFEKY